MVFTSAGGSPVVGQNVAFSIISGPNAGQFSGTVQTDATGSAVWQYTGPVGSAYQGADIVKATVLTAATDDCDPIRYLKIEWAPVKITVEPLVATAVEPATSGGGATVGSIRFTRTGDTTDWLTVSYGREGTALYGSDYEENAGGSVTFSPNQTQVTVTITPYFDGLPEAPETVVLRVDHAPDCAYAAADPDYATVTVNSSSYPTVTASVVDGNMNESGTNPGSFRLTRSDTSGDLQVVLAYSGTASYGVDYLTDPPLSGENTVTIPDGLTQLDVAVVPIPDTRSELPKETVVVTIVTGPQSQAGSPASVTLDLTDDDTVSLPASGYTLTDLGAVSGTGSFANGVNSLSPNPHAVGTAYNVYQAPYTYWTLAYRWQNGGTSYLPPPSGWGAYSGHSSAISANDTGTTVGQSGYYYSGYVTRATYWSGGYTTANQLAPLATTYTLDNLAVDINQRVSSKGGLIVGQSIRSNGKVHAVAWIPDANLYYSGAVDLLDLADGSKHSHAAAINDFAQIVGRSQIGTGNNYHGFVTRSYQNWWNNDQWEPLGLDPTFDDMGTATGLAPHTSEFNDINNYGEVVGRSHTAAGQLRAIYKAPGTGHSQGYHDLGVLGAGTANAGTESVAYGVSANGIIVGQSRLKVGASQVWRAFVHTDQGNAGVQPLVNLNDVAYTAGSTLATSVGWTLLSAERVNAHGVIVGYGTKNGQNRAFLLTPK